MMWDARLLTDIQAKTLLGRKPKWSSERELNSGRPSVLALLLQPINSSSNWTKTSQIRNQNVKKKSQRMFLSVSHHEESVDTLKQYIDTESVFEQTSAIYSFIWCLNPVIAYYNYLYAISKFFSGWNWPLCYVFHCLVWFSIPDCNNSWSTRHPGSIPDQHISNKQLFINHKLCNNDFTYW